MEFRPCIDIHNGKVKQIVGGSLVDKGNQAEENFVSEQDGSFYANLYKKDGLKGGHIIILNPVGSEYYEADVEQAMLALRAYPGGLQVGGGITNENAKRFIDAGASHVVVTSYVFKDGKINYENLNKLVDAVGKEHLVLDLSCRKKKDEQGDYQYYVVTDRWQKFTDTILDENVMNSLSKYCDEFLIHAVDVEGKANGVETELVKILSKCKNLTITYAGGVGNYRDLEDLKMLGNNQINVTIGSALDLFGGGMCYENVLKKCKE
ncbi:MAG: phosphoribosylformimino-5-aminoimidazole carboxamide ribotide isomerase [Lachnospiraceae bacterium]|nr:phosphoribosylformimino-5-aminoimidazole carboxamide ribotide isomerase [Lachnospiraceae bacterium]